MTKNEEAKSTELQIKYSDYVASAAKAILGAAPFAGSLLAEIAGVVIPNQRIERIAEFARMLEIKLSSLEESFLKSKLSDQNFTDLMEEGLLQAAHSLNDERREYIASILANGLTQESIKFAETRHLLRILGEINDIEVIWLRFHLIDSIPGDEEFREKHADILEPIYAGSTSSQEEFDRYELQKSYKEHLSQLGLLNQRYEMDSRGNLKSTGFDISGLGRLLLRQIGFKEECVQ